MRQGVAYCSFWVVLVLTGTANAGSRDIACATAETFEDKAICAWEDYSTANVELIRAINHALIVVDGYEAAVDPARKGGARAMLVEGHEAWQIYREETCKLETRLYFGGAGEALAYARCLERLTKARLADLNVILEDD